MLGADGRATVALPTSPEGDAARTRYTLEGDVEDASGQHIANRAALVVHPASLYVALSRPADVRGYEDRTRPSASSPSILPESSS